jgi:hypothetical protein
LPLAVCVQLARRGQAPHPSGSKCRPRSRTSFSARGAAATEPARPPAPARAARRASSRLAGRRSAPARPRSASEARGVAGVLGGWCLSLTSLPRL